jgi:hypothetical protein
VYLRIRVIRTCVSQGLTVQLNLLHTDNIKMVLSYCDKLISRANTVKTVKRKAYEAHTYIYRRPK